MRRALAAGATATVGGVVRVGGATVGGTDVAVGAGGTIVAVARAVVAVEACRTGVVVANTAGAVDAAVSSKTVDDEMVAVAGATVAGSVVGLPMSEHPIMRMHNTVRVRIVALLVRMVTSIFSLERCLQSPGHNLHRTVVTDCLPVRVSPWTRLRKPRADRIVAMATTIDLP